VHCLAVELQIDPGSGAISLILRAPPAAGQGKILQQNTNLSHCGACAAGAVWCAIQRKRADMTYHPESAAITPRSHTTPQPRLFDEVRRRLRLKHYSLSTERIYLQWMRRFILASGRRHPRDMGTKGSGSF